MEKVKFQKKTCHRTLKMSLALYWQGPQLCELHSQIWSWTFKSFPMPLHWLQKGLASLACRIIVPDIQNKDNNKLHVCGSSDHVQSSWWSSLLIRKSAFLIFLPKVIKALRQRLICWSERETDNKKYVSKQRIYWLWDLSLLTMFCLESSEDRFSCRQILPLRCHTSQVYSEDTQNIFFKVSMCTALVLLF